MGSHRSKKLGITEGYWAGLSEDRRIMWKFFSRALTFVGALAVSKTGVNYIDWIIAASTTVFSFLLIESQRSYTRYSVGLRKKLIRVSVALVATSVLFAGGIYFSQAAFFALASTYTSMPPSSLGGEYSEFKHVLYVLMFVCAGGVAIVRVFRQLDVMGLIYHLPRQQMTRLLVHKECKLEGFPRFACFELGVIVAAICYSGVVASLISGLLEIVRIAVDAAGVS